MTILQRAATLAAVTFAFIGVAGIATPGLAQTGPNSFRLSPAVFEQAKVEAAVQLVPSQNQTGRAQPDQDAAAISSPIPLSPSSGADRDRYETLAAAVAAQGAGEADAATRCLAGAIYFEAKGEPIDGQLAVAEVVLNRAGSGRFPTDVCGVITQRGQFSFVHGGAIPAIDTDRAPYRTALAVARVAMANAWESRAPRALFFHARRVPPSARWVKVAAIGNHVFYR